MSTKPPDIEGISVEMLCRYVEMRKRIDAEAKTVYCLSSMLALLQQSGDDRIEVDPVALGHVNGMISHSMLNIQEMLDDFIFLVRAESELGRVGRARMTSNL